jgi:branched-chain amino acid transport system permease protein
MRRSFDLTVFREILKPLAQIAVFILGSGFILSSIMLLLALALAGTPVDELAIERYHVDLFAYTLSNLPQVLLDGVTIGFVYAAIALGYTMVYGVLELSTPRWSLPSAHLMV